MRDWHGKNLQEHLGKSKKRTVNNVLSDINTRYNTTVKQFDTSTTET